MRLDSLSSPKDRAQMARLIGTFFLLLKTRGTMSFGDDFFKKLWAASSVYSFDLFFLVTPNFEAVFKKLSEQLPGSENELAEKIFSQSLVSREEVLESTLYRSYLGNCSVIHLGFEYTHLSKLYPSLIGFKICMNLVRSRLPFPTPLAFADPKFPVPDQENTVDAFFALLGVGYDNAKQKVMGTYPRLAGLPAQPGARKQFFADAQLHVRGIHKMILEGPLDAPAFLSGLRGKFLGINAVCGAALVSDLLDIKLWVFGQYSEKRSLGGTFSHEGVCLAGLSGVLTQIRYWVALGAEGLMTRPSREVDRHVRSNTLSLAYKVGLKIGSIGVYDDVNFRHRPVLEEVIYCLFLKKVFTAIP